MNTEIPGQAPDNQDILDLGLDPKTTARFIDLRQKAQAIVKAATESPEGLTRLSRVMGFLNSEIEAGRADFTNRE